MNTGNSRRPSESGFSLIELLVSIVIMAEILIGVAILYDSSSRLARAQTHVAELQQSLRVGQAEVVRFAKAAGIGGLPITRLVMPAGEPDAGSPDYDLPGAFPRGGYAVSVLNDYDGTFGGDQVLPGSDVLIVRGVFTTPLFYFDPPLNAGAWGFADVATTPIDDQEVVIPDRVRAAGAEWEDQPQDISALGNRLAAAKAASQPVALIIRNTLSPNAYSVMEFDLDTAATDLQPGAAHCATLETAPAPGADPPECIKFKLRLNLSSEPSLSYAKLMKGSNLQAGVSFDLPSGDPDLTVYVPSGAGSIGLLEEFRFFVRAEYEVPGETDTRLTPVLSRASYLPGTSTMIDRIDIADNVIDLQIAVGTDIDNVGIDPVDGDCVASTDPGDGQVCDNGNGTDEVLFNSVADQDNALDYKAPPGGAATWYDPAIEYHFLRINTLVQSRFPDRKHRAPVLVTIEDHNRGDSFSIGPKTYIYNAETMYHRRWLQTVVELRNLQ